MKNGVHGDPSSGLRALATAADADAAFAPDTLLDDAARATQCAPVLSRHERAAFEAACRGFAGTVVETALQRNARGRGAH